MCMTVSSHYLKTKSKHAVLLLEMCSPCRFAYTNIKDLSKYIIYMCNLCHPMEKAGFGSGELASCTHGW